MKFRETAGYWVQIAKTESTPFPVMANYVEKLPELNLGDPGYRNEEMTALLPTLRVSCFFQF